MPRRKSKSASVYLLLTLVVLGAWLRFGGLTRNSLWFDEVFSQRVARDSDLLTIARDGVAGDVHPPLYFMLLHLWVRLVGDSVLAMRALSAILSLLMLPACYWLTRLLAGKRAAILALGLAALLPVHINYAAEARQYALSATTVAWLGVGIAGIWQGKRWAAPIYVLSALAALYTHYFAGLVLAAAQLWFIAYPPARARWRIWLPANALIALAYAPQLVLFVQQASTVLSGFWIARPSIFSPLYTFTFLLYGSTLPATLNVLIILLTASIVVLSVYDALRWTRGDIRAAWLLCGVLITLPILAVLLVSLGRSSIYLHRSFLLLTPFFCTGLAIGVASARRPSPTALLYYAVLLFAAIGLLNYYTSSDVSKPPFRDVAAQLAAESQPNSRFLFLHDSEYLPLMYYLPSAVRQSALVNIEGRSWLLPRTWEIFGVQRLPRGEVNTWLAVQRGTLYVVMSGIAEPPEQQTMAALLNGAIGTCALRADQDYPPFLIVYTFDCG
jgi:uncharacterized membrane protein